MVVLTVLDHLHQGHAVQMYIGDHLRVQVQNLLVVFREDTRFHVLRVFANILATRYGGCTLCAAHCRRHTKPGAASSLSLRCLFLICHVI